MVPLTLCSRVVPPLPPTSFMSDLDTNTSDVDNKYAGAKVKT